MIDARVDEYSVDALVNMRREHEKLVDAVRSEDAAQRLADDVLYAEIVDEWTKRALLDEWDAWTSGILLCGQPSIRVRNVEALRQLAHWLLRRVWPGSNLPLEAAFLNYRTVLLDLLNELVANSLKVGLLDPSNASQTRHNPFLDVLPAVRSGRHVLDVWDASREIR